MGPYIGIDGIPFWCAKSRAIWMWHRRIYSQSIALSVSVCMCALLCLLMTKSGQSKYLPRLVVFHFALRLMSHCRATTKRVYYQSPFHSLTHSAACLPLPPNRWLSVKGTLWVLVGLVCFFPLAHCLFSLPGGSKCRHLLLRHHHSHMHTLTEHHFN